MLAIATPPVVQAHTTPRRGATILDVPPKLAIDTGYLAVRLELRAGIFGQSGSSEAASEPCGFRPSLRAVRLERSGQRAMRIQAEPWRNTVA
jgi:hypothetical protein